MTNAKPYRARRRGEPAEGPAQTDRDARSSLPPGAGTKPDLGARGDVDRSMPYESDQSPERMVEQPFREEPGGDRD